MISKQTKYRLLRIVRQVYSTNRWWFLSHLTKIIDKFHFLILILMEYALWVKKQISLFMRLDFVLILILMEYTLWVQAILHNGRAQGVLILILMEYALWECVPYLYERRLRVLILILMEYALRDENNYLHLSITRVLILILMEYTLRDVGTRMLAEDLDES